MARKALGKGLRALIPDREEDRATPDGDDAQHRDGASTATLDEDPGREEGRDAHGRRYDRLQYLPVESIEPNANQPRQSVDPSGIEELARSIEEFGLLEPVLVRPHGAGFQLVAGERRWRACLSLGWRELPAIVRQLEADESLEAALIENIQRADLNPVEEAKAYERLALEYGRTHEEIARRVGKDRSSVTNVLRLLRLPPPVLEYVSRGTLSLGHARVLVGLPAVHQIPLAEKIVAEGWSVRQTEEQAGRLATAGERGGRGKRARRGPGKPEHMRRLEETLCRQFGAETHIRIQKRGGKVEIAFHDEEELSRLLDLWGIVVH